MKRGEITLQKFDVKWKTDRAFKRQKAWSFDYRKIFTIVAIRDNDLFFFKIKTYAAMDGVAEHYLSPYYNIKGVTTETSERKIQFAIKEFVETQALEVIKTIAKQL